MNMGCFVLITFSLVLLLACSSANSKLFREYIGADSDSVKFTDVPINPNVEFHFILAFAIDYPQGGTQSPTNGDFHVFWDPHNLSPTTVSKIKATHPNVKVAVSLGGASVDSGPVYFKPKHISSWVKNAVSSLTKIIQEFNLDGIDIDYENFKADPDTFAECIGQLIMALKEQDIISFASIAPYEDVQSHYWALWRRYAHLIDYVNFQFYAYDVGTSVPQFIKYFDRQTTNYKGGKILASITTDGKGGLGPEDGFFEACKQLKEEGKLGGIFIWSADDSKKYGFKYEEQAQDLLAP